MALISPGVEVTVIDESQFTPTAAGTIAYVLLATAQDKITPQGTVARGTLAAAANRITTVTSQRELVNLFGSPNFDLDAAGNPVNGSEINEYGLLAAYSALGVSNQLYIQRADIDLRQLDGTSIRPTGLASEGTYWLDLATTNWGIFEWSSTGFLRQTPDVITDTSLLSGGVPVSSYGAIGTYAVVATTTSNPVYYKGWNNDWVLVGSDAWLSATPIVTGTIANPSDLAIGQQLIINGANISITGTTVADVAADIDGSGIPGVSARENLDGFVEIFADSTSASSGNIALPDGKLSIASNDAASSLGLLQNNMATVVGNVYIYNGPEVAFDTFRNTPAWRSTDVTPRPFGSVWFKTSAAGQGANWAIKRYNGLIDEWVLQSAPFYSSDDQAIFGLDPVGGGAGIAVGSLYVRYDTLSTNTGTFKLFVKDVTGVLKITGPTPSQPLTFTAENVFVLEVNVPGSESLISATITLSGTTAASFVADILAADLPNIVAAVEPSGAVSISHLAGGIIRFVAVTGTPLTTAGWTSGSRIQTITAGVAWLASPFTALTYTFSNTAPYSYPPDGTLWYFNNALQVDIMIHDGSGWRGYQNVASDARGFDLTATDSAGPILSASQPVSQSSGGQLAAGDLWVDTSDLENYPVIRRYNGEVWELIDNTDQIGVDGIVFADARWAPNDDTDPVVDDLPSIVDLLSSDYLDDDAPDFRLYPRGSLLFNTRRSGFNVKRFESNWFPEATDSQGNPLEYKSAWVSTSGIDSDGVPFFGHWAQRNTIVEAMKAAISSSVELREEQQQFNLICCPGYPELINDMITLNNDRLQTAFIIGDSPLSLDSSSTTLDNWARNNNLAITNGLDGLVSTSEYLGVYYPSGLATNLDGNTVVVPPSHMMLRTFIRSDNVSYPWFAPAGVRRGLIDNVTAIGYIDVTNGNVFRSIGVTNGLRDVLYANRVNPLTVLPGVGLVAYGQKTRAAQTSAMDRINVARLTCYLRTVLAKVAAPFIFEPNDTITRSQVQKAFESVLNDVVAKRGIFDYLVVCDTSNNTPDRIDRNELYVDIAIQPVKAIEFIYIPVRLRNTGASLTTV